MQATTPRITYLDGVSSRTDRRRGRRSSAGTWAAALASLTSSPSLLASASALDGDPCCGSSFSFSFFSFVLDLSLPPSDGKAPAWSLRSAAAVRTTRHQRQRTAADSRRALVLADGTERGRREALPLGRRQLLQHGRPPHCSPHDTAPAAADRWQQPINLAARRLRLSPPTMTTSATSRHPPTHPTHAHTVSRSCAVFPRHRSESLCPLLSLYETPTPAVYPYHRAADQEHRAKRRGGLPPPAAAASSGPFDGRSTPRPAPSAAARSLARSRA
jgi:hypothetical protein